MFMKEAMKGASEKLRKKCAALLVAVSAFVLTAVPAFASSGAAGPDYFQLTADDLAPAINSISANGKVMFPVVLIVASMFIVFGVVLRLLKKGSKG